MACKSYLSFATIATRHTALYKKQHRSPTCQLMIRPPEEMESTMPRRVIRRVVLTLPEVQGRWAASVNAIIRRPSEI